MTISGKPSTATTDRIIQKVRGQGFRQFIEWVGGDDGHLNPVFIATFAHPTAGHIEAFCKLYPYRNGKDRGLVNEITGYLFGRALEVPQPDHAFLANIPIKYLRDTAVRLGQNHWLNSLDTGSEYPAFCTSRLDGKSAAVHLPQAEIPLLLEDVAGWINLPKAVALDENIAHADRHLNNLIRLGRKRYAVIDNGRLVNPDGEWWSCDMLESYRLYRNRLSEHVWNHAPSDDEISKLIMFATQHANAYNEIADELAYWLKLLLPQDHTEFEQFLRERATDMEWLVKSRYNRLV